jgi:hypothetical protein
MDKLIQIGGSVVYLVMKPSPSLFDTTALADAGVVARDENPIEVVTLPVVSRVSLHGGRLFEAVDNRIMLAFGRPKEQPSDHEWLPDAINWAVRGALRIADDVVRLRPSAIGLNWQFLTPAQSLEPFVRLLPDGATPHRVAFSVPRSSAIMNVTLSLAANTAGPGERRVIVDANLHQDVEQGMGREAVASWADGVVRGYSDETAAVEAVIDGLFDS